MSLQESRVGPVLAVSDIERATEFYEGKLGLSPDDSAPEDMRVYRVGGSTGFTVYLSPEHAGRSTATLAGWSVDDLESLVDELSGNGVEFEQYDDPPLVTNERGIVDFGDGNKVAFFRDPDG